MRVRPIFATWILLVAGCGYSIDERLSRTYARPETLCLIKDSRVKESSGVAASLRHPGTYFTHNDSGDYPRFYRFNEAGKVIQELRVKGATAQDWEDIASFERDGEKFLAIGDIGNNGRKRKSLVLYVVKEPDLQATEVDVFEKIEFVYPDAYNAEALLIMPGGREFQICVKMQKGPSKVFAGSLEKTRGIQTLKLAGEVDLGGFIKESRMVTGGAVSPDGKFLALRTYMSAYEWDISEGASGWTKKEPMAIRTNLDLQGEGIAYAADGNSLITTAENQPCLVSVIRRK
jgi:hypothetical protein